MRAPAIAILVCLLASPAARADQPVSFRNDVMAVLSKAGCNAGGCHGKMNGRGGLKLSLRGQEPADDLAALTRDFFARRVDASDPDSSLILLKATGRVPHEGGVRFKPDSDLYKIVRDWIASGARADKSDAPRLVGLDVSPTQRVLIAPESGLKITASARFSDGTTRDVSNLAVYEQSTELAKVAADGTVTRNRDGEVTVIVRYLQLQQPVRLAFVPARPDFAWAPTFAPANYVDEHVLAKLRTMRINPSAAATDGEFLRRAYLDLLGVLPTADESRAFVADTAADKRTTLIDALLDRPEYAEHWALKWSDLLRNEERTLDRKGVQAFHRWIKESFVANKPLDQFVRELIAGKGSTYANPPANYYRANRDPVTRGEATAQLFLGVRLQCAQCHNHPFDRWTQDDYYGWADVFARVDYKVLENRRLDKNDSHEFVGEQVVFEKPTGDIKDPRGADRKVKPRLLGIQTDFADSQSRLDALGAWVTSPTNPFFAKSQANRIWFHLMGRGLVDPIDDFRPTNPPSHPELLDRLAAEFTASQFDVKKLIRTIMTSQTYGLSAEPKATNAADDINYSHALVRRLTAEQLLDAQHQVAGVPAEFAGYPKGIRAGQLPGVRGTSRRGPKPTPADTFLVTFGKPPRVQVCECERSMETTLGQTFQMVSGPGVSALLASPDSRIAKWIESGASAETLIDDVYWSALSRPASDDERTALAGHIAKSTDKRKAVEDVLWAILNSKEFVLRR
ncbi:MAG: DUF1549 and DUF1553 domain-containing protein [Phycisphaerae bacterium]|nr:DUF1549 and DUF1553 domain-containing protein [Tepidisphaeraceae bacterium]